MPFNKSKYGQTNFCLLCEQQAGGATAYKAEHTCGKEDMRKVWETSKEDLKRQKRRCWSPDCKRKAFLRDWGGWQWCLYHWYRSTRWGQEANTTGKWIWHIKRTKIF